MTHRRPLAPLAALSLILTLFHAAPARAVSLAEAVRYARATLGRLCNDADASRFSRIDQGSGARDCRVSLEPGRLRLWLTVRRMSGQSADRAAGEAATEALHQDIGFDARSHFYCSGPDSDGFSTLYMNCLGASSRSGAACVAVAWETSYAKRATRRETDRRSFAAVASVRPEQCGRLERAFNFIASRSRGSAKPTEDDPFR